jgi:DNA-binding CsgD family transcriptional regulator
MQAWQVWSLTELGSWDAALQLCAGLLAHPDLTPVTVIPAAAAAARIRARRGEDATGYLGLASSLAPGTGELQRIGPAACAEAETAWLEGRLAAIPGATEPALQLVATHPDGWILGELLWWRSLALPATASAAAGVEPAEPFALMLAGRWTDAAAAWEALSCPAWVAYSFGLADDVEAAQRAVGILERLGAGASIAALLRVRRERGLPLPRRPRAATRANAAHLTARELDILLLLAEGLSTAEIADQLVLSPRTVEHHVSAILRKLGEPARARAVAAAWRLGVLQAS